MSEKIQEPLKTVGLIAKECGCATHQVQHVIRSRRIRPIFDAGNCHAFSEAQVNRIKTELSRIAARRMA